MSTIYQTKSKFQKGIKLRVNQVVKSGSTIRSWFIFGYFDHIIIENYKIMPIIFLIRTEADLGSIQYGNFQRYQMFSGVLRDTYCSISLASTGLVTSLVWEEGHL